MKLTRRNFLVRSGLFGLGLVACADDRLAAKRAALGLSKLTVESANQLLRLFWEDTFRGVLALVVPGDDDHSKAQGLTDPGPGGVASGGVGLYEAYLEGIAVPELTGVVAMLGEALAEVPLPLGLDETIDTLLGDEASVLDAVTTLLAEDVHPTGTLAVALLLNVLATEVSPTSALPALLGPKAKVLTPFARLSHVQKIEAMRHLEQLHTPLVALIDERLPTPYRGMVSGLLRSVAAIVFTLGGLIPYSEGDAWDPNHPTTLSKRPVGWDLSNTYPDGVVEGWDEFQGYYQGRTSAT